jgi:glycosyltransferase involved in cell wall biosynthesis
MKPLVSVLLPVYNAQKFLSESIESILTQTYQNLELIVVDDASTDDSWQIMQLYKEKDNRVKIFQNIQNLKLSRTLNKALSSASGKYIARMDADDISLPDRIQLQVDYMESHPEVGICGGRMNIIGTDGVIFGCRKYHLVDKEIRSHIFRYSPYSHPLIMMRKNVLDQVGGYRHEYNPAEDYELYFRIGEISRFGNLPHTLLNYRIVGNSMTTGDTKKMERLTIRIRDQYRKSPHYTFSLGDYVYNTLHKISLYTMPSSLKMKIFHLIRNKYL